MLDICSTLPSCPTGLDSADLVSQLRAAHASDDTIQSGVDVIAGRVGSMQELGIFEAYKVTTVPWAYY